MMWMIRSLTHPGRCHAGRPQGIPSRTQEPERLGRDVEIEILAAHVD
jgi:hypothetical protein